MSRAFLCGAIVGVSLLALPGLAGATRPATEQEITEFKKSARELEAITECAHLAATASSSNCEWAPREGYEPLVSEARVSTLDESWATAHLTPAPRTPDAETAIFRRDASPSPSGVWRVGFSDNGCDLGRRTFGSNHGTEMRLAPDLVVALGCTPEIPTKVRCLDRLRRWLLAFEQPRQCAVAGPETSPIAWMSIRDLRWHRWGRRQGAWALGALRGVRSRLVRNGLSTHNSQPGISAAVPLPPFSARLVGSGLVSCGTAYFYSTLRVISAFGRFKVALPTCPDQFFAPR